MIDTRNNLRIVSLNVYHGMLKDELSSFVLERMGATSVFCFQETNSKIHDIFDTILLGEFVCYSATKPAEPDDLDVSIYVRKSITVLDVTTICGEIEGVGLALRCELSDEHVGRIAVSSVHGAFYPGSKLDTPERLEFSRTLIESSRGSVGAQVIMGDFNLMPSTESVQMFAANGFRNLVDEFQIPTTRNELAWQRYAPDMKQLFADYTFLNGYDAECSFVVDDITVSDHLPMTLELRANTV